MRLTNLNPPIQIRVLDDSGEMCRPWCITDTLLLARRNGMIIVDIGTLGIFDVEDRLRHLNKGVESGALIVYGTCFIDTPLDRVDHVRHDLASIFQADR